MSYNPTNWQNLPATTSPVIAEKLNNMENGIEENDVAIGKEVYDNTQTYSVGDYCIYNNVLYRCKTAVTTAESFDNSKWEATNILEELSSQQNYSTTETRVGTWTDGKPLYRKVVELGNLPNTATKSVALGITNLKSIVRGEGYFFAGSTFSAMPFASSSQPTYSIDFYFENGNALITTYRDRSNWQGSAIVYYTKTTD